MNLIFSRDLLPITLTLYCLDIWIWTITDERKKEYLFSLPYFHSGQVIVTIANAKETSLVDFVNKTGGVQVATTGEDFLRLYKDITVKTYLAPAEALDALLAGEVDFALADTPVAANFAKRDPKYKNKLRVIETPITTEFYVVLARKNDRAMINRINKGIQAIIDSGKLKKIRKEWL